MTQEHRKYLQSVYDAPAARTYGNKPMNPVQKDIDNKPDIPQKEENTKGSVYRTPANYYNRWYEDAKKANLDALIKEKDKIKSHVSGPWYGTLLLGENYNDDGMELEAYGKLNIPYLRLGTGTYNTYSKLDSVSGIRYILNEKGNKQLVCDLNVYFPRNYETIEIKDTQGENNKQRGDIVRLFGVKLEIDPNLGTIPDDTYVYLVSSITSSTEDDWYRFPERLVAKPIKIDDESRKVKALSELIFNKPQSKPRPGQCLNIKIGFDDIIKAGHEKFAKQQEEVLMHGTLTIVAPKIEGVTNKQPALEKQAEYDKSRGVEDNVSFIRLTTSNIDFGGSGHNSTSLDKYSRTNVTKRNLVTANKHSKTGLMGHTMENPLEEFLPRGNVFIPRLGWIPDVLEILNIVSFAESLVDAIKTITEYLKSLEVDDDNEERVQKRNDIIEKYLQERAASETQRKEDIENFFS